MKWLKARGRLPQQAKENGNSVVFVQLLLNSEQKKPCSSNSLLEQRPNESGIMHNHPSYSADVQLILTPLSSQERRRRRDIMLTIAKPASSIA
jgi:hypothetical protein